MDKMLICVWAVLLVGGMVLTGCSKSSTSGTAKGRPPDSLNALLKDHRGNVLILLLGIEGCPGTAKATEGLDEYVGTKPEQVSVVRLDVPPPNKTLKATSERKHRLPRFVDAGRKIADELDFFYYPTLYVFDGDGVKRYVGGYDRDKIAAIARDILAEKPGAKKKIYTPPMPAVGEPAPAFSGGTLTGKAVSKDSLLGKHGLLIFFARTSCPYSMRDIPEFKDIADHYRGKGLAAVAVNMQEDLSDIKPLYEGKCAGESIIWDRDGKICKSFGVDAVPFFFLTNEHGKVVARGEFTHTSASDSINAMLGLKAGAQRFKPTKGG
jgi:peroxiredoxin